MDFGHRNVGGSISRRCNYNQLLNTKCTVLRQTRIITEKIVNPPNIAGVRFSKEDAGSGRVNQQKTSLGFESRLRNGNQSSFYVENLNALKELIHWYAIAKPKATQSSGVVQQTINTDAPKEELLPTDSGEIQDILEILGRGIEGPTSKEQLIQARLGQGKFKKDVTSTWGLGKRCAVTGVDVPQLLIASHIIPWREAAELRLDGRNGILLCSHLDKLFDRHLISFDATGQLVMSMRLSKSDRHYLEQIGIHKSLSLDLKALKDADRLIVERNLRRHQQRLKDLDISSVPSAG